jgi:shikimate dehydrogenase
MTDIYGILGHPIGHSRSPAMHNRAFADLGIDAMYVPFAVPPERLPQAVAAIRPLNLRGLNVTLPHKTTIMALLDKIEPDALAIGAVNTIYHEAGQLVGMNTDAPGLSRAVQEAGVQLTAAKVSVLGAGGAARASVVGLARAGAARIVVMARRNAEAERLVKELQAAVGQAVLSMVPWESTALSRCFADTNLVVQATSATLDDGPGAAELSAALPFASLPAQAAVIDLVYRPRETLVLKAAQAAGKRSIDGLGMLLHQGAIAFEKWLGLRAPVKSMREALEA